MVPRAIPPGLLQFVEDEQLRAPLLFDQLIDGTLENLRNGLSGMTPLQRSAIGDLIHALPTHRTRLAEYFMRSLQEQVQAEIQRHGPKVAQPQAKPLALALVDDDIVALDVELAHAIEGIKSTAEYELRELATFISALVGDMDVAGDHNPFRAETWARAVWAAAQALPLSRNHQVRSSGTPARRWPSCCARLRSVVLTAGNDGCRAGRLPDNDPAGWFAARPAQRGNDVQPRPAPDPGNDARAAGCLSQQRFVLPKPAPEPAACSH
jgi:hypothetical protein